MNEVYPTVRWCEVGVGVEGRSQKEDSGVGMEMFLGRDSHGRLLL